MTAERRWERQSGRPLVIAHRGASKDAPENTLAAFRLARTLGADGVELDVMRCGSGELVVFHDDDLVRLLSRPDRVDALPLSALREHDLGGGERIPTLSEAFEELGPGMLVNVELKTDRLGSGGLEAELAALLVRIETAGRVLVSSFNPFALARFRRLARDVPTGLLFHQEQRLPLRHAWPARWLRPAALHPEATLVDAIALARWRARGYLIHAWTVDDPREVAALAALDVDGIITNEPVRTRAALDGACSSPAAGGR